MISYTNFNTFSKKLNTFSKFVTIFLLSLIFTNGAMTGRIIYSNIMYHNFLDKGDIHERIRIKVWLQPKSEACPRFCQRRRYSFHCPERQAWLHQSVRCHEQLAAGTGAEKGHRPPSRCFLQACKPGRCRCSRSAA